MIEPTILTWLLIAFGLITCCPLLYAQSVMIRKPRSDEAQRWMIGEGEVWRDRSHFKTAYSLAVADWLLFVPVLVTGIVGVIMAQAWGYVLFAAAGSIQLYINVFLWWFEREYVYETVGPWAYYTYFWGNFIYWGLASLVYSVLRLIGIAL